MLLLLRLVYGISVTQWFRRSSSNSDRIRTRHCSRSKNRRTSKKMDLKKTNNEQRPSGRRFFLLPAKLTIRAWPATNGVLDNSPLFLRTRSRQILFRLDRFDEIRRARARTVVVLRRDGAIQFRSTFIFSRKSRRFLSDAQAQVFLPSSLIRSIVERWRSYIEFDGRFSRYPVKRANIHYIIFNYKKSNQIVSNLLFKNVDHKYLIVSIVINVRKAWNNEQLYLQYRLISVLLNSYHSHRLCSS